MALVERRDIGDPSPLVIGILKEARPGETRVAATPATVEQLLKLGYEVVVAPGAGLAAGYPDQAYIDSGAATGPVTGLGRVD